MKSYDLSGKIIYMQMKAITEREYAKMEITRVFGERHSSKGLSISAWKNVHGPS